jgi:hypothetical protein
MTRRYTKPSLRFVKVGLSGIASRRDRPYANDVTKLGYLVTAKNPAPELGAWDGGSQWRNRLPI